MQKRGVEFEWRDLGKEPLSKQELNELIGKRPVSDFLNPRSTPYRELGLKDQQLTKARAIELMLDDVNLLRRPLAVKGSTYVFGFDEQAYRRL